jgi:hypothetical protein
MAELIAFKSGRDLGEETRLASMDTVTCVGCDKVETDERAYDEGWQMEPPVCPACLHWTLTDLGECCSGGVA